MGDIIWIKSTSYAEYEEALLRRDNLKKEAEQAHMQFIMEFGDLIERSFTLKVECIRKKKEIGYCQRLANQGKRINSGDLTNYIETAMREYYSELRAVADDVKRAKESKRISQAELRKIKEIYYRLAKLIHPDMHPELEDDDVIMDYWHRISIAYQHNNLKEIEELEALVKFHLEQNGKGTSEIDIPDIEDKIREVEEEIDEIISNNPYLYKLLLRSKTAIKEKRQEYLDEIESYRKYSEQLDEVLAGFEIEEMMS